MNKNVLSENSGIFFLLIGLIYLGLMYFFPTLKNLNRTIGWGWDYTNPSFWFPTVKAISFFIFALGYWILTRFSLNIYSNLIIIHLFLAGILTLLHFGSGVSLLDWLIFGLNWIFFIGIIVVMLLKSF